MGIRIKNLVEWMLHWPIAGTATTQIDCATTEEADADKYFERSPVDCVIAKFGFIPSVAQVGGTSTTLKLRVGTTVLTKTISFSPTDPVGTPKWATGIDAPVKIGEEIKLTATKVGTITTSLKGTCVIVLRRTRRDRP